MRFPGDDTAQGQWPHPRPGEWPAATAGRPAFVAFWPPLHRDIVAALRETTLMPPAASDRSGQARLVQSLEATSDAPRYELVLAEPSHWIWQSIDGDGERVFWCRRWTSWDDSAARREMAVFPWQPDDVIPLFARDSLEWAGRIRIGRVGIRPDGGAAATGYITGHSIHDGTIQ